MLKTTLLTVLAASGLIASWASTAEARQRGGSAQILLGVNFVEVKFDKNQNLGLDWSTGFLAGVGVTAPHDPAVKHSVTFTPEAFVVQKGGNVQGTFDEHIRLTYVETTLGFQLDVLPVLGDNGRIVLNVAPTLAYNIRASNEINGTKVDIRDDVKHLEAGLMVGATVPVVKDRLDVSVRYEQAFTHLFKSGTGTNRELLIVVTPRIFHHHD